MDYYIAKFRNVKGRYLVRSEGIGVYGGQRIADRRQLKYGNQPDPETGLWLYESYRVFGTDELIELRPYKRKEG
jgi:hypothetical protein